MTRDERVCLFRRDLQALALEEDAMVLFSLARDEDAFVQYSHLGPGAPFLCEVSNRAEGSSTQRLDSAQEAFLRGLGYEIPSPHHHAIPHKEYAGDIAQLVDETEQMFRIVLGATEDDEIESSGVMW